MRERENEVVEEKGTSRVEGVLRSESHIIDKPMTWVNLGTERTDKRTTGSYGAVWCCAAKYDMA